MFLLRSSVIFIYSLAISNPFQTCPRFTELPMHILILAFVSRPKCFQASALCLPHPSFSFSLFSLVPFIYSVYPQSQLLLKPIMNVKIFCNLRAASKQSCIINTLLICRPFDRMTLPFFITSVQIILTKVQRPATCPGQAVVLVAVGLGCVLHNSSMVKT